MLTNNNGGSEHLPSLTMPVADAEAKLDEQIAKGQTLAETGASSLSDLKVMRRGYGTWNKYNGELLRAMFDSDHWYKEYTRPVTWFPSRRKTLAEEVKDVRRDIDRQQWTLESVKQCLDLYVVAEPSEPPPGTGRHEPAGEAVFIIHGHDRTAALELKDLIRDEAQLEVVLMDREPHGGRTLIKKFEDEAGRCGFAIAVITPDDKVAQDDATYAQMRPNVVFELGWFYGRMSRKRTCVLLRKPAVMPSDLDGIGYHDFEKSVREVWLDIRGELREAGLIE